MDFKALIIDSSGNPFVTAVNYICRILFSLLLFWFAPGITGTIIAIAYLIVLHPLAWKLGDKFRQFTQPDVILTSGALETFTTKVWWMFMPQALMTFVLTIILIFFFSSMSSSNRDDEITKTPPMALKTESVTNYSIFDINTDRNFGSNAFLSATMKNPVVLTGGVHVLLRKYGEPDFTETPDKNIKKLSFPQETTQVYIPESCIEKLVNRNREIQNLMDTLPGKDCTSAGCTYLVDPKQLDIASFKNQACSNIAVMPSTGMRADVPDCEIRAAGELFQPLNPPSNYCKPEEMVLVYSEGGTVSRARDLERLRYEKLKNISQQKSETTEKP